MLRQPFASHALCKCSIAGPVDITATDARTGAKQLCHEGLTRLGLMSVSGRLWRLRPHPSPLMLLHPLAGQALGLGDLVGGHALGDYIPVFLRAPVTLCTSQDDPERTYAT